MQSKALKFYILLVLLSTHQLAQADMIFMNFHESQNELKAVQNAAESRGEKLWVISPKNKDETFRTPLSQKIKQLDIEMNEAWKKATDLRVKKDTLQSKYNLIGEGKPWYKKAWDGIFNSEYLEMLKLNSSIEKLNKEIEMAWDLYTDKSAEKSRISQIRDTMKKDLNDTLEKIQKSGKTLSTLVVSGHHTGERFWGNENLEINEGEIREVLKKHPKVTQNFYSYVGWGCHTGELDDIQAWKEAFPQLKVIIGFAGSGPLEKTQAASTSLEDILKKETALMVAQDMKVAQNNITKVKDANVTYLAGLVNQCYVGTPITKISPMPFSNGALHECTSRKDELLSSLETYQHYFYSEGEGYEDIPLSDGPSSPLRKFYNNLESYRGCYVLFSAEVPPAEQVVGLIHAKIIQKNFEAYYGLKSLGKTRKEVLENGNKLTDKALRDAGRKLVGAFECVPASWITEEPVPGVKPASPDSRCLAR